MTLPLPLLTLLLASALELAPPAAGVARLYFVRHGQALSNLDPAPELPPAELDRLTPLGHTQSRAAGATLRGRSVVRVVSSPAGRARETAEDIRAALAAPAVEAEPQVRPLELGTGQDWDRRIAAWEQGKDPRPAGGESLDDLGQRVRAAAQALARTHPGGQIVVVAHSEVIGALVGLLQQKPPAQRYPFTLANGSITVVDVDARGTLQLRSVNHVPE